jgi:hypothetical protein
VNLADEIAVEILRESVFRADLAIMEADAISVDLARTGHFAKESAIDSERTRRLCQAALVFSECNEDRPREIAQRISTAVLKLTGGGGSDIYQAIQARLGNYPSLVSQERPVPLPPVSAPLSLTYEFVWNRTRQTVAIGDGTNHILTSFQVDGWGKLQSRKSVALSGPTSAGKSYILLLHLVEYFRQWRDGRAAYVVPTRALINQVSDDAVATLAARGLHHISVTSVPIDVSIDESSGALYVVTQERLDALLTANPNLRLGVVVVDEAQVLGDGSRGVLLEAVIDRLGVGERECQFIFSGPLIGNPEYFGRIFDVADLSICRSTRSPVTQNIIFLDYASQPASSVQIRLRTEGTDNRIASIELPIRLVTEIDRLSYLSFAFGRTGTSIVYAAGKADAEKIAIKIAFELEKARQERTPMPDLIKFVKKHIHKDYSLVKTLEFGVGFHYGHMPSLLRKQLEDYFRMRSINFLVCTSTLLHGVNLPAKNLFLSKPTTGRGTAISGPAFWNLSGRVGRLGKEIEGNVFLIDYDQWGSDPLSQVRNIEVVSALSSTISTRAQELLAYLRDPTTPSGKEPELEMSAGKLVLDQRTGRLNRTLARYAATSDPQALRNIQACVEEIAIQIDIPTDVLSKCMGVSIFRQKDLLEYMIKRLMQISPEELIPAHPLGDFTTVLKNYIRVFKRIHTHLARYPASDKRHTFFAPLALRWMRGDPLPVLIDESIRYNQTKKIAKSTSTIIREVMEDVEENLRFLYVKYFSSYNALLELALERSGKSEYIDAIPNIPLFLEVGGSSGVMVNLMALGLSRISAEAIAEYATNKEMSVPDVREWLRALDLRALDISPICISEIEALRRGVESA